MAGQLTQTQITYKIMDADGVLRYTAVTRGAKAGEVKKPTADNMQIVGLVVNDERNPNALSAGGDQTGRNVAVQIEGIGSIRLAEPVAYGQYVIAKAGGLGAPIGTAPGMYHVIGIAEKDGVAGDVIPVTLDFDTVTIE
jgi:hypothetical protein